MMVIMRHYLGNHPTARDLVDLTTNLCRCSRERVQIHIAGNRTSKHTVGSSAESCPTSTAASTQTTMKTTNGNINDGRRLVDFGSVCIYRLVRYNF